jgi:hypothetical protein
MKKRTRAVIVVPAAVVVTLAGTVGLASAAGTITGEDWHRECFNTVGADDGWVKCNFNVPEYESGDLWAVNKPFIGNEASKAINTSGII